MARQVRDTMRRAFWDALQEKLREDPPDLSHAVVLLQEVKQVARHTNTERALLKAVELSFLDE